MLIKVNFKKRKEARRKDEKKKAEKEDERMNFIVIFLCLVVFF